MNEIEAQTLIEAELTTLKSYEIKVVERDFKTISTYIANFGILTKEGNITTEVIKNLVEMIQSRGDDDIRIVGTKMEMKDFSFDILIVSAEIKTI